MPTIYYGLAIICNLPRKTRSGFSPTRNPIHLRLRGLSLSVLGDVPNWDSGQTQSLSFSESGQTQSLNSLGLKVRIPSGYKLFSRPTFNR